MGQIVNHWWFAYKLLDNITPFTTLLNIQFSFRMPSKYNSRMLEKLCRETQLQIELLTYPKIISQRPMPLNNAQFPFIILQNTPKRGFMPHLSYTKLHGNDVDNLVSNSTNLYIYLSILRFGQEWVHFPYLWVQKRRDLCGNCTI